MDCDYDSDEDILPEARILDICLDNISNLRTKGYDEYLKKIQEEKINESSNIQISEHEQNSSTAKSIKETIYNGNAKTRTRNRKRIASSQNKNSTTFCNNEDNNKKLKLSAVSKKRLRQLELETALEKERVDEEVDQIFQLADSEKLNELPIVEKCDINLRIRYMSNISKLNVPEEEKFSAIVTKVADMLSLKASEILLVIQHENIDLSETPKSLNLKFTDIIDCIAYSCEETDVNKDTNKLRIKIQSNDSRKKVELYIHKLEPLLALMEEYAQVRQLPLCNLCFKFDGENISGVETPEELDMEDGSCIDVFLRNFETSVKTPEVVDLENESLPQQNNLLETIMID